jgi:hypothetical protein
VRSSPKSRAFALADPRVSKALSASWSGRGLSINADDWPGVVVSGAGWRIVLSRDASRYRLQRNDSRGKWQPVYGPADPLAWGAALAGSCPDLAAAVQLLPVNPFDVVKAMVAAQAVPLPQVQRRAYWREPDYSGVLRTDANMRSVRDAVGAVYALQWVKAADLHAGYSARWITQASGPSWPGLVDAMASKAFTPGEVGPDSEAIRARLAALFEGFPELATDGPWNKAVSLPLRCAP